MEEEWKTLNQTNDYDISNHGRVRSHRIRKKEAVILKGAFLENDDPISKKCVDHIDGNRCNNRVNNLRWVTYQQNNHNRSLSKTNKSGVKGVHFNKFVNRHVATWRDENGKHCHQSFTGFEDAVKHRRKMVEKYYDKTFYKVS